MVDTCSTDRGRVQFCEELVTLNLGLLFCDGAVTLAGRNLVVAAEHLHGAVWLDFVVVVTKDPRPARPVLPRLYSGMLNACLHSQASSQPLEVSFRLQSFTSVPRGNRCFKSLQSLSCARNPTNPTNDPTNAITDHPPARLRLLRAESWRGDKRLLASVDTKRGTLTVRKTIAGVSKDVLHLQRNWEFESRRPRPA